MNPSDFIYNQAFKRFMSLGYSDRDAGYVGAEAVHLWKTTCGRGTNAVEAAVAYGKKNYVKIADSQAKRTGAQGS